MFTEPLTQERNYILCKINGAFIRPFMIKSFYQVSVKIYLAFLITEATLFAFCKSTQHKLQAL